MKPIGKLTIETEHAFYNRNLSAYDLYTSAAQMTFEARLCFKADVELNNIVTVVKPEIIRTINKELRFVTIRADGITLYWLFQALADTFNKMTPEGREAREALLKEVPYEVQWHLIPEFHEEE